MLNIQISAFSHRLFCGLIIGQRHVLAYLHRAPGVERNGAPEVILLPHSWRQVYQTAIHLFTHPNLQDVDPVR